jgi:GNAT superfamily N-acetyltransferase
MAQDRIEYAIRDLATADSLAGLTDLLHAAYGPLGARGLNYTAVDQPVETTASRVSRGHCFVAESCSQIVGTILVRSPDPGSECPYYRQPHVASVHQFGVLPRLQGRGIGSALLRHAEKWAGDGGFRELALDTAAPAVHLLEYYERRGYRLVGEMEWPGKRYRSVVLSKPLAEADALWPSRQDDAG